MWVGVAAGCSVGCQQGSDPVLWLWHRLTAASLIQPLAQELPYATGEALKRKKIKIKLHNVAIYFLPDKNYATIFFKVIHLRNQYAYSDNAANAPNNFNWPWSQFYSSTEHLST